MTETSTTKSSVKMLVLGISIGLLSLFLPQLPTSLNPFSSSPLSGSSSWAGTHGYASSHPRTPNHDPSDVKEPREERERRLQSKDGDRERDRELMREMREVEGRAEGAGMENGVGRGMPVYWAEADDASVWEEISERVRPKRLVVVSASASTTLHLSSSSSSALSQLKELLSSHAMRSTTTSEAAGIQLSGRLAQIPTVRLLVPMGWKTSQLLALGKTLRSVREDGGAIVVVRGPDADLPTSSLDDALVYHTAEHREVAVESLLHTARVDSEGGLFVAVGAAGESEAEYLAVDRRGWRFGHVPLRKWP